MQQAIYERGPVAVSFMVYSDFGAYEKGVYIHKGKFLWTGINDGLVLLGGYMNSRCQDIGSPVFKK